MIITVSVFAGFLEDIWENMALSEFGVDGYPTGSLRLVLMEDFLDCS